jgi:glycosyltransferase involved in cell wall biosynthesis
MKVLIIEPCYVNSGGYFRAKNIGASLAKKGIRVDMLVSSNKNFQLRIKKKKINDNFYQYELPRINLNPRINFTGRVLRGIIGLIFSFRKKYDIYHVFVPSQFEANIPGFFLKLLGKRVVMDWDDYFSGSPLFEKEGLTKKYVAFCETRVPLFFENMTVISDFLQEKARERGAKRIIKLTNGVSDNARITLHSQDDAKEKLGLDRNKKYLFAFGTTQSRERTLALMETFDQIYNLDPNIILISNFDSNKIIKEMELSDRIGKNCVKNILNAGYIKEEDLEYYLSAASAAIMIQGESEDEIACCPMRITSYLGAELVIIMNDVNSEVGNILKKYECAILDKDLAVLAKKTVDFLNDENLQKKLIGNVRIAKEELSQDKIILKLIDFYKSILAT